MTPKVTADPAGHPGLKRGSRVAHLCPHEGQAQVPGNQNTGQRPGTFPCHMGPVVVPGGAEILMMLFFSDTSV